MLRYAELGTLIILIGCSIIALGVILERFLAWRTLGAHARAFRYCLRRKQETGRAISAPSPPISAYDAAVEQKSALNQQIRVDVASRWATRRAPCRDGMADCRRTLYDVRSLRGRKGCTTW